jgi:multiple sugar transport system substrate-binding protein
VPINQGDSMKIERRNWLSTALAASMAVILVGCAASDVASEVAATSTTAEEATVESINVLSLYKKTGDVPEGAAINLAVDSFTSATGISVNFTEAGENLGEEYEATVLAGQAADVIIVNLFDKSSSWVANGAAIPVNDLLQEWGLDTVIKSSAVEEWTNSDGQVQGFAYQGFTWPVWYNTALLQQAGVTSVPTTSDELIEASKKLRAAGIGPVVVGGNDWSGNKLWLQFAQMFMPTDEAISVFTDGGYCASPNAMKGIAEFVRLRDAGVFVDAVEGYTADQMNAAYFDQKAAIMPAGSWAMPGTPDAVAAVTTLGGLPIPAGSVFNKPTAYEGNTGVGFFISPNGQKKLSAVKEFILSFYQPNVIGKFVSEVAVIPATTIDISAALGTASPLLNQAVTSLQANAEFAVMPDRYVGARGDALTKASALAFGKGITADAICKAADQAYD